MLQMIAAFCGRLRYPGERIREPTGDQNKMSTVDNVRRTQQREPQFVVHAVVGPRELDTFLTENDRVVSGSGRAAPLTVQAASLSPGFESMPSARL